MPGETISIALAPLMGAVVLGVACFGGVVIHYKLIALPVAFAW